MIKRILTGLVACLTIASFASCGCARNTTETQPTTSKEIDKDMQIGEYAAYVTRYVWVNKKSGDKLDFNDDGSFKGKIAGKEYSGRFTLKVDEDKLGRLIAGVTLDGQSKPVEYTIDFKNTAEMTVTTDKGDSESYAAG